MHTCYDGSTDNGKHQIAVGNMNPLHIDEQVRQQYSGNHQPHHMWQYNALDRQQREAMGLNVSFP
ncbi:hypothetical protein D1872_351300 [compost metagenome]